VSLKPELSKPAVHWEEQREAKARKEYPVATGVIDYFPDAIKAIAKVSYIGNEQHNPGTHLHWDRSKSGDEADALMRHFLERGTLDTDGVAHSAKMAWRALALLQKEIEMPAKRKAYIVLGPNQESRRTGQATPGEIISLAKDESLVWID
jgi:hypothetical protein